MAITVIYDACVLYPAPLRDFLMWLALTDIFKAKWSNQIHDEWIRNVLKNRPDLTFLQLNRTRNLMNNNIRDCLVIGYESLIPTLNLPDAEDCHVLAAAIHSNADFIVTFNLKDFPVSVLSFYGVEAINPDEFILELIDINSVAVCQAVLKQLNNLKHPPLTREQYWDILRQQGLIESVNRLQELFKDTK